jgi:phosphoenolpyruvate-protein phosphotransferase (PTS system enzyme I)
MVGRTQRRQLKGVGLSSGIGMGRSRVIMPGELGVTEVAIPISRIQSEVEALDVAVAETVNELRQFRDSAARKMANPIVKIFDTQILIASDYEFLKQVKEGIASQRHNAAWVYNEQVERTVLPLTQSNDPYMRQMVSEIQSVAQRIIARLKGANVDSNEPAVLRDCVMISKSFSPGQVLTYRNRKTSGLLVCEGGHNSHMALIARSLMTPLVVMENSLDQIPNGCRIIIDGSSGVIIINPTDEEWVEAQRLRKRQGPAILSRIKKLTPIPPLTADGVPISIAANLELPGPIDPVLAERHIPIGLYRTEFLYLQENGFPDEKAQFEYYDHIAEVFSSTSVILRTYDLGSDKIIANNAFGHEDNPALGWRGIRCMLEMPELFKTQIKAMLRASTRKNLKIMLPMISDLSEFERAQKLISQVMLDLRRASIPFDENIQVGIMVEVPSAALTANLLAPKVDFISIGTNDLTQYTLSADRTNARVARLFSPYHPSVLQLIKMTVDACKKHRKTVSICGEVAGDQLALPLFIGMGVEQLSMNPTKIFDMCRLVKRIDSQLVRLLVNAVMESPSATIVTKRLESFRTALDKK